MIYRIIYIDIYIYIYIKDVGFYSGAQQQCTSLAEANKADLH